MLLRQREGFGDRDSLLQRIERRHPAGADVPDSESSVPPRTRPVGEMFLVVSEDELPIGIFPGAGLLRQI